LRGVERLLRAPKPYDSFLVYLGGFVPTKRDGVPKPYDSLKEEKIGHKKAPDQINDPG
jgi:hypothetical protein